MKRAEAEASTHCVFASVVLVLVSFAESLGLERARIFAIAGLEPGALDDPDEMVPYEALVRIWQELVARHPREPLGLRYATLITPAALGVVGYAVRHAKDGHEALALTLRFSRLVDPFLRFAVAREGELHVVRLEHEPRVVEMVEPLEMLVLATVLMATSLFAEGTRPEEVLFRHPARHPPELYADVLGFDPPVPVRFGASFDGVVFPSVLLDAPVRTADARMAMYLARHAEALLEDVLDVDAPLEERVRHAIRSALPSGDVTAEEIAKTLRTSVRTLQRELQERGTSLSHEVDHARKERALVLLRRPELTVAEVAFMLGYAESRVFLRSFKRWTGLTPTAFRRTK